MNLREYKRIILASSKDDWTVISCWGAGSAPSYLYDFQKWEQHGDESKWKLDIESHGMVASLKTNLSITMAWGLSCNPNFREEWANKFPDERASSNYIDFFYNGALVYRDIYVSIDGGRGYLPVPIVHLKNDDIVNPVISKLTVSLDELHFMKLLDDLSVHHGGMSFEAYLEKAGITVEGSGWME